MITDRPLENNETVSPYGLFALNIGSDDGMIIKNNTVNASGGYYFEADDLTLSVGIRAAHFVRVVGKFQEMQCRWLQCQ